MAGADHSLEQRQLGIRERPRSRPGFDKAAKRSIRPLTGPYEAKVMSIFGLSNDGYRSDAAVAVPEADCQLNRLDGGFRDHSLPSDSCLLEPTRQCLHLLR